MKETKQPIYLPVYDPTSNHSASGSPTRRLSLAALGLLSLGGVFYAVRGQNELTLGSRSFINQVKWTSCGARMECATIDVPLDWHNSSDPRRVSIAVAKHTAHPAKERLGSIFINPGGPGGSGSAFAYQAGPLMSQLSGGHYDIIGFDPRGINQTRPYVSCFDSALDEHLFQLTAPTSLDIPANFSVVTPGWASSNPTAVTDHLFAQVRAMEASFAALYDKCYARSGHALAYVGTEAVVRDIDHMSNLIEGPEAKINFWGMSYGTIVGQYLTAILPAERLGRIVMDGVVDWESWSKHSIKEFAPLADTDRVLDVFADACAIAGDACALSHLGSAAAILSAIDSVIDRLYVQPAPVFSIKNVPGLLARSYHARQLAFLSAYSIKAWAPFANAFAAALEGDYSKLLFRALPDPDYDWVKAAGEQDSWSYSTHAIRCADQPLYSLAEGDPAPTAADVAEQILNGLNNISSRLAEQVADLSWCKHWPAARKSLYAGTFEMGPDTLATPVLILNQRYDPITPLNSAKKAMVNLGNNARLVEQNGTGHCAIGQASLASAKIMRRYWIEGVAPESEHTLTEVDEHAFERVKTASAVAALSVEDRELLEAWSGVGGALFAF